MKRIKEDCHQTIIVNKSRFICYLFRVFDDEQAKSTIKSIKKQHPLATHHCDAYIISSQNIKRAHDDGEPTGTAGRPMLDTLEKNGMDDILAITVRYFGGILLGTGGLVRAYTDATIAALESSVIVTKVLSKRIKIHTDYNTIGKVLYELGQRGLSQESSDYTEVISITIIIPSVDFEEFEKRIIDISFGKSSVEVVEEMYCEHIVK